jgi:hypothetical protein
LLEKKEHSQSFQVHEMEVKPENRKNHEKRKKKKKKRKT